MKQSKTALAVIVALACSVSLAQRPLRLQLEPGSSYYNRLEQDQQIEQQMMGQTMRFDQSSGFGWDMEVLEADQDGTWVELTYDWVMLEVEGPGVSLAYDSAIDEEVPDAAIGFAALLGLSFRTLLSEDGEILEVAGLEQMQEQFREQLPPGPAGQALAEDMGAYLTEDMIRQQMHYRLSRYPAEPVDVGDSWQRQMEVIGPFGMVADYQWQVARFTDSAAVLNVRAELSKNPQADAQQMPEEVKYDLEGAITGTSDIELETGLVRKSDLQMQVQVQMHMDANGQEITIPMNIVGTIRGSVEDN